MSDRDALISSARLISVLLLAALLGWSGVVKLRDPGGFALAVYRYDLVPNIFINALSLWIATTELLCAITLVLIPRLRRPALWLVIWLLVLFTAGVLINLVRGSYMACGCFSTSALAGMIGTTTILRNLGLIVLSLFALKGTVTADR